ncbi:MAG: hypothetical protein WDN06_07735 [Asticcacaulis sp.]
MFSRPIRLGIVGLGKIAIDQHLPAVAKSKDFKLVAACSLQAPETPFPVYEDFDEMLRKHPDITAVVDLHTADRARSPGHARHRRRSTCLPRKAARRHLGGKPKPCAKRRPKPR